MLIFISDCKKFFVVNEGRLGKDINNVFIDLVGFIIIIERDRYGGLFFEWIVFFIG